MKLMSVHDTKSHKSFIANLTFDYYRSLYRSPLFLNRNIMRVLAHHDKRRQTIPNPQGEGSEATSTAPADRSSRASTSRALRDRFRPVYHEREAEFIVELVDVRKKLNFKSQHDPDSEPPTKRARRDDIPCFAYLAIWDNREGYQSADPIVKQSQECTLHPYESNIGAPAAHITMAQPFTLKARDLFVPVRQKDFEVMMVADKYVMEIKVLPSSTTDLWPPIPILNKSEGSLNPEAVRRAFGSTQGYLVSNYLNLPFAPASDVPLSVSFDQGGRTYKTKYGFEVSSHWVVAPSPLEQSVKKEEVEEEPVAWYQQPTPTETESNKPKRKPRATRPIIVKVPQKPEHLNDTVHVKPKTTICYIFEPLMPRIEANFPGFQSCRVEGYWCPTCRTEFITLRQLHFHLTSSHPKFNFSVDTEDKLEDSNIPARVTIRVEEAEIFRERASNSAPDPREMVWMSPSEPLDVDAYLNGDHRWLGGPLRKKKIPKPPSEKTKNALTFELPRFRHPDNVSDLSKQPRTKRPVPRPKTAMETPFYRSISHQVLDSGEALSESDDEIDQSWLKQKHSSKLAEQRAGWFENDVQRRLRVAFDEHLMDERFPNTRYVSDAFVRFLRNMEKERWLWEDQGRIEIVKVCTEMLRDGLMNQEVFRGITEIMMKKKSQMLPEKETSPCVEDSLLSLATDVERSPGHTLQATTLVSEVTTATSKAEDSTARLDPDMYGVCGICCAMISRRKQMVTCSRGVSLR